MMGLMFLVFYFLLIRPQQKRQRQHQEMLKALDKGDMVITRGGVIGKITGATDRVLTIEVHEKMRIRVLRSHIDGKYDPKSSQEAEGKAA